MPTRLAAVSLAVLGLAIAAAQAPGRAAPPAASAGVLQHHGDAARHGVYADAAFTRAAAARLHRDPAVRTALPGPTYAQPLYWAATGGDDRDRLIVATEQDIVLAVDPATGASLWRRSLGRPVPRKDLQCGNIDPLGITGTPVIDAASRTLFVDAMTTPDGGRTKRHVVAALGIDDGAPRPGWPVDLSSVRAGAVAFDAAVQNQRGALAILGDRVYVPFGGHFGDCGAYHGWVVGLPRAAPGPPTAWATRAAGGGIWAPGGIASDGRALYVATGNTSGTTTWADGEAVLRLGPGPRFSGARDDFFAPADWHALDESDRDLGGSGPLLIDVPGATPSRLVVALGKDGKAYLLDAARLGGIGGAVAEQRVAGGPIITAAAAYRTARGTYVVFKGRGRGCPQGQAGSLTAIRIEPGAPPRIAVAWCAEQHGQGSPIVTTTDGRADPVVWSVGAEGDERLHGFDGETGRVVFDGGGEAERMAHVRRYVTPIVAGGRLYVAADDLLYAFTAR